MFTGIIQEIGKVVKITKSRGREITVSASADKILDNIHYGDSISVNGTCQTVISFNDTSFTFFTMAETLEITTLSELKVGDCVNLEPAITMNTLLGGHLLSGHIDGIGNIVSVNKALNSTQYKIKTDKRLCKYIVKKGSIAVDGVSLTVYDINENIFTVAVIPTTSQDTILSLKNVGDNVNLETDIIAKYVEKLLQHNSNNDIPDSKNNLNEDFLRKHGYK